MSYYINTIGVEMINICNDPRYDFESISETGIGVDNSHDYGADERDMGCGYESVISYEILEHKIAIKNINFGFMVMFHMLINVF